MMLRGLAEAFEAILAIQVLSSMSVVPELGVKHSWKKTFRDLRGPTHRPHDSPRFENDTTIHLVHPAGRGVALPCRVLELGSRVVSWMRKKDLHILSTGLYTFTGDSRFQVVHGNNSTDWNLYIRNVSTRDSGSYECQVSTEPKISLSVNLTVVEPFAVIPGPPEVHIREGSDLILTCLVQEMIRPASSITWEKEGKNLDITSSRGGISIHTETRDGTAVSRILLLNITMEDGGRYSCRPTDGNTASTCVHIIQGELTAAMQSTSKRRSGSNWSWFLWTASVSLLTRQ